MNIENILEYEKLVYSIINKFSYYGDKDDLYQVGMMGLIKASKNYKESTSAKFSTYAYTYILGEITKYIRENKTMRVSRDLVKLNLKIEKSRDLLRQKLLREPNDTELALYLDITLEDIYNVRSASIYVKSLDEEIEENGDNYYNSVKTYDKSTRDDFLDLFEEIEKLDKEDKRILYDRYFGGYTQSELSKILGISQVQVSRKENKILEKLKVRL